VTADPPPTLSPLVWFPDTSFLYSASVSESLFRDVREVLERHPVAYLKIVAGELSAPDIGGWPGMVGTVLGAYAWLGDPLEIRSPKVLSAAWDIQTEVANSRALKWDGEHLAEAMIIAVAETAERSTPIMLSEDYDARVAAINHGIKAMSIHRLLHNMIRQDAISSARAFEHSEAIRKARRGPIVTEDDLIKGRMGRIGRP
jgi:hypothetical protein